MARPLVFMMGPMPAILPVDRRYVKNHMWVLPQGPGFRFGLSSYAVRLLGDIEAVEWAVGPGAALAAGLPLGSIEGSKASTEIYAPAAGTAGDFNLDVLADPPLVNSNLYDRGWLFDVQCADEGFLSPEEYVQYLTACWPLAQRMLRGHAADEEHS